MLVDPFLFMFFSLTLAIIITTSLVPLYSTIIVTHKTFERLHTTVRTYNTVTINNKQVFSPQRVALVRERSKCQIDSHYHQHALSYPLPLLFVLVFA